MKLSAVFKKISQNKRISPPEAVLLFQEARLPDLQKLAFEIRKTKKPDKLVTFIIDRNINYTNVCQVKCKFCAFSRDSDHPQAYTLTPDEILEKVKEAVEKGATQIMLQGGINPELKLDYFQEVFAKIKQKFPEITIHSLSAPEIEHLPPFPIFLSEKF